MVAILRGDGHLAGTVLAGDPAEIQGVNDQVQLAQARRALNGRLLEDWMRAGVTIVDPAVDLDRRGRDAGAGREIMPGHAPGGADGHRRGRPDRPRLPAQGHLGRPDAMVLYTVCESAEVGPGADRRALRLAAPGYPDRRGRAHRHASSS